MDEKQNQTIECAAATMADYLIVHEGAKLAFTTGEPVITYTGSAFCVTSLQTGAVETYETDVSAVMGFARMVCRETCAMSEVSDSDAVEMLSAYVDPWFRMLEEIADYTSMPDED